MMVERCTGDETISSAVLGAIAQREAVDVTDLQTPLYEWIDPDLLNALFQGSGVSRLEFDAYGHEVCVTDDGTIVVDETIHQIENRPSQ